MDGDMEELYREYAKLVYHFLYTRCKDTGLAEDLTQETFLQACRSIGRYDGSCKISVWLCQIAKHLLFQTWRKQGREIVDSDLAEQAPQKTDTETRALAKCELMDVLKEMQRLPGPMREVIYLRITGDLSFREIAEILGKSENWARVNYFRGKELLLKWKEK